MDSIWGHVKTKTDIDSEKLFSIYLEFRTMDEFQEPSESESVK
jgi:hypothetical protein